MFSPPDPAGAQSSFRGGKHEIAGGQGAIYIQVHGPSRTPNEYETGRIEVVSK